MAKYGSNRAYPVGLSPLDPDETLDYIFDWSAWLLPVSDSIATSSWEVPTGITAATPEIINSSKATRVWLSVNDPTIEGSIVTILNRITTSGGRTADRSVMLRVESK